MMKNLNLILKDCQIVTYRTVKPAFFKFFAERSINWNRSSDHEWSVHDSTYKTGYAGMSRISFKAFTLAELLIALAILGVISTFTIPKVLQARQNTAWNAEAKEAIGAISQAYVLYGASNTPTGSTASKDFVTYFNYVKLDTVSLVDHVTGQGSVNCSTIVPGCMVLHNGAYLVPSGTWFGGTANSNYTIFLFDPDGKYSGNTTGPGKAIDIDLHFNGKVNTSFERKAGDATTDGGGTHTWGPDLASDWFSWDK
jgi:prepilin-type N-terminal cleavage/methylation domain-containing protein